MQRSFYKNLGVLIGVVAIITLVTGVKLLSQETPSYQRGTLLEVKVHKPTGPDEAKAKQYDLSIKVKNTVYVVLYTPPTGSNTVEYMAGMDRPVYIEGDTMKFSDLTGKSQTLPILSRKELPVKKSK